MGTNYNTPAFPINEETPSRHSGMTLLDYFAAQVLQSLTHHEYFNYQSGRELESIPRYCYKTAAAMLEERKKYIK